MAGFDIKAARAEGYTDAEIAAYLAQQSNFDLNSALNEGYTEDEIIQHLAGPIVAKPKPAEPDNSAAQWAGVLSRAAAPYLAAGSLGAAVGAPIGGVGAIPGAAAGVLALGAGDIGTSLYNAAAPLWSGQRVALPSETIQNAAVRMGLARNPETAAQQVVGNTASGLMGGIAEPAAMAVQATKTVSPTVRAILNSLAEQRAAQAGAGAGAAAAPSIAQNYFDVTNPAALAGLSMAGGMVGGRATAGKPTKVTKADLANQSDMAYRNAEEAGVNISPEAMTELKDKVEALLAQKDYDPAFHPLVKRAAAMFEAKADEPMSFKKLEAFRRAVRDLPYSEAGGASGTKTERAMVGQASDAINDFMQNLSPEQTTSGNPTEAFAYLSKARDAARKNFEADLVEQATTRAGRRTTGTAASNLRNEFSKIANKPNRMNRLTPETQQQIEDMAAGKGFRGLQTVGKFAPQINLPSLGGLVTSGAGAAYMGRPELAVLGGVTGGAALAAKTAANRMATSRANAMADMVRGTQPFRMPTEQIAAQSAMQGVKDLGSYGFPLTSVNPSTGETEVLLDVMDYDGNLAPSYGPKPFVQHGKTVIGEGIYQGQKYPIYGPR